MSTFEVIDLFKRYSASTDTNMTISADSIDTAGDGGVVFYANGKKAAIAYLGSGFIVQEMDESTTTTT